jgi:hypothetical protein
MCRIRSEGRNFYGVLLAGSSTDCKYAYVALQSVRRE